MKLVEQHIIKKSNPNWKQIDHLCFLSKNLYNYTLYYINKHYTETGKFIRYNDIYKKFQSNNQLDFKALPCDNSCQILMLIDKSYINFYKLLSKWKKNKKSLNDCPRPPKYKHKTKGRNIVIFTCPNQIRIKEGYIHFPKKVNLQPIKTNIDLKNNKIKQVRLIPKSSCYTIEIVYEELINKRIQIEPNNNYLSIDLGLNNLMACYNSSNSKSFIINGKPLKSINQYYNKKQALLKSNLKKNHNKYKSHKLDSLNLKRNNKIKDYLHKSSRFIINYCISNNISNIVIGYNKEWKTDINIGKRNNQNFVNIPYYTLLEMIKYKALMYNINVITNEESYTSKCSSLDLEPLCHKDKYYGKRVKRGLYISKNNISINADINGSINILRKVTGDKVVSNFCLQYTQSSRGQVTWPLKVNPLKTSTNFIGA